MKLTIDVNEELFAIFVPSDTDEGLTQRTIWLSLEKAILHMDTIDRNKYPNPIILCQIKNKLYKSHITSV